LKNRHSPLTGIVFITLIGVLAFGMISPALAQSQARGVRLEAQPAFDGNFKYGEWLPVYIQLENTGPDVDGEARVRITGRGGATVFSVPVSLPTGSRKLTPLYVLANNFSHSLEVEYVSKNQVLASQKITVRPSPNITFMIGIASPERGGISLINASKLPGITRRITLVDFGISEIPDKSEGLRSLDVLIINNTDTSSLTQPQKTAIDSWVRNGGRLVIGGGAGALQTSNGLTADLLPVVPRTFSEHENLPGLATFAQSDEIRVPGPFVSAVGDIVKGSVLAEQDGIPLVVEHQLGNGYINFISLDLAVSPFDAWSGTTAFWETLLSPSAAYPDWVPPDMSSRQLTSNQMTYALSNLPSLDLPSVRSLGLLLAFYVALVGPINYLLLRWRKRLHWAWITIPLITVLFSAGAFSLGYAMRGTDLILNRIVIAELQPGGTATTKSYYGLFSPSQTSYDIEVSGGGLISQLVNEYDMWSSRPVTSAGEVVLVQGDPNKLYGLSVNQWSLQSFMVEGVWNDIGQISSNLKLEGSTVNGQVRNNTDITLKDTVLVMGNNLFRIGVLEPGEEVEVELRVTDIVGGFSGMPLSYRIFEEEFNRPTPGGAPRQLYMKQSIIDNLFSYGSNFRGFPGKTGQAGNSNAAQVLLLGWFDTSSDEVLVGGKVPTQQTTALFHTQLPYSLGEDGSIFIPAGLIPGAMTEMPIDGGTCGAYGLSVYLGRGDAIFEFYLPEEYQNIDIDQLNLQITSEGGWEQKPDIYVYDWTLDDWVLLENGVLGRNVLNPNDNWLSSGFSLKTKLSAQSGFMGGCYYLGLGLEGSR
jgi:hypothetical protein